MLQFSMCPTQIRDGRMLCFGDSKKHVLTYDLCPPPPTEDICVVIERDCRDTCRRRDEIAALVAASTHRIIAARYAADPKPYRPISMRPCDTSAMVVQQTCATVFYNAGNPGNGLSYRHFAARVHTYASASGL